jgi:CheY-like chemotaxis protein
VVTCSSFCNGSVPAVGCRRGQRSLGIPAGWNSGGTFTSRRAGWVKPRSDPNLWPVVAEAWAPQPDRWRRPILVCETPEPALHRPDSSVDGPATTLVLLVDDEVLLREDWLVCWTGWGLDVVGQTGTSGWILLLVRDLRPDPVVVDIRRPPTNTTEGLDAARQIRAQFPATAIPGAVGPRRGGARDGRLATGQRIGCLLTAVSPMWTSAETLKRIVKGGSVLHPALVHEF